MNHLGGEQADPRMTVLLVVPGKEILAETACILDGSKAFGKIRSILERFELGFGVRVIITGIGSAVSLGDPKVCEQKGHGFRFH